MAYDTRHYTLTLNGSAQRLSSVLPDTTPGGPDDLSSAVIVLQPDGANANPVFVGGPGVTTSDFGFRMEPGAAGAPPAPYTFTPEHRTMKLSSLYVIGTSTQKLHILQIGF